LFLKKPNEERELREIADRMCCESCRETAENWRTRTTPQAVNNDDKSESPNPFEMVG